ncbi:glycosyltransferase family 4 protein [Geomonas ferrireducens]|uniref:glycosyltransferase family 4 protein n=1 Tax=Geomonas ferrireducens TaxID=2570227 RepID=UPI0013A5C360|nr:glycosyltransferase family 4 protein [Geomonas ferrireducens]
MQGSKEKQLRACFVYYQSFSQLLYREAITLKRGGFYVDVICLRANPGEEVDSLFEGMRVRKIVPRYGAEKSTFAYFARLIYFFTKTFLLLSYLSFSKRYHLIHITAPPDAAIFTTVIGKLLGAKVILDIHDIGPELYMRKLGVKESHPVVRMLKAMEKASASFADHVITVTHLWRNALISRSTTPEKCSVMLNVPDNGIFRFVEREPRAERFNLFYHGSVEEHFGVDTLLDAMPLIKLQIPHVKLHIYPAKRGRLLESLQTKNEALKLQDSVFFHESVPFYELPGVLADADLGIVPTKNHIFSDDAVSSKSFDYIFSGIPIVISRTAGHSFYYTDDMVKFFEPCNSADLAAAVTDLYRNKEMRQRQVRQSLKFIEDNSWDRIQLSYLNIVKELIDPAAPGADRT